MYRSLERGTYWINVKLIASSIYPRLLILWSMGKIDSIGKRCPLDCSQQSNHHWWNFVDCSYTEVLAECLTSSHVSVDPTVPEVLTPNHFYWVVPALIQHPFLVCHHDLTLWRRWRMVQVLMNHFWRCWLKEYYRMMVKELILERRKGIYRKAKTEEWWLTEDWRYCFGRGSKLSSRCWWHCSCSFDYDGYGRKC